MRREEMNEYIAPVGMNRVSIPESWLFICDICSSSSKSDTARNPRMITSACSSGPPRRRASTSRPPRRWRSARPTRGSSARASSGENTGSVFSALRSTATMTRSKRRCARSTISRCPLWNGSNDPGKIAVVTAREHGPVVEPCRHGQQRSAVSVRPMQLEVRRKTSIGRFDSSTRSGVEHREELLPRREAVRRVDEARGRSPPVMPRETAPRPSAPPRLRPSRAERVRWRRLASTTSATRRGRGRRR